MKTNMLIIFAVIATMAFASVIPGKLSLITVITEPYDLNTLKGITGNGDIKRFAHFQVKFLPKI